MISVRAHFLCLPKASGESYRIQSKSCNISGVYLNDQNRTASGIAGCGPRASSTRLRLSPPLCGRAVGENSSRPGGLRAGSPPSPSPRLIRPTVRRLPRSPRLSDLFDDGIKWLTPFFIGIVHHNVDEYRHKKPKDFSAVLNLRPVDTAVPG